MKNKTDYTSRIIGIATSQWETTRKGIITPHICVMIVQGSSPLCQASCPPP